jgi:hypothetical protein
MKFNLPLENTLPVEFFLTEIIPAEAMVISTSPLVLSSAMVSVTLDPSIKLTLDR